jgi:hypothetical protein
MMLVKVPTAVYHSQFQSMMFEIVLLVNVHWIVMMPDISME